jgi:hypothetical protein
VIYDPEDVGAMLWKWLPRNEDFQDLRSWRELVVATAVSLRRHHASTLIVPMSLIRDAYRSEILDGLADSGEEVLHVFLNADGDELKRRLQARGAPPNTAVSADAIREWAFSRTDKAVAAAGRQPKETLVLRSDQLSPARLADQVLAAVDDRLTFQPPGASSVVGPRVFVVLG